MVGIVLGGVMWVSAVCQEELAEEDDEDSVYIFRCKSLPRSRMNTLQE